jgi:hypothetical protein
LPPGAQILIVKIKEKSPLMLPPMGEERNKVEICKNIVFLARPVF